jgi:hypothetical protein
LTVLTATEDIVAITVSGKAATGDLVVDDGHEVTVGFVGIEAPVRVFI